MWFAWGVDVYERWRCLDFWKAFVLSSTKAKSKKSLVFFVNDMWALHLHDKSFLLLSERYPGVSIGFAVLSPFLWTSLLFFVSKRSGAPEITSRQVLHEVVNVRTLFMYTLRSLSSLRDSIHTRKVWTSSHSLWVNALQIMLVNPLKAKQRKQQITGNWNDIRIAERTNMKQLAFQRAFSSTTLIPREVHKQCLSWEV